MGKEFYVKIVGALSFLLAMGFLVSSSLFLASTRDFLKDSLSCSNNVKPRIVPIRGSGYGYANRRPNHDISSSRNVRQIKGYQGSRKDHDHDNSGHTHEFHKAPSFGQGTTERPDHPDSHEVGLRSSFGRSRSSKSNLKYRMFLGLSIAGVVLAILQLSASFLGFCANKKTGRKLSILWMFTNMIFVIGLIIIFALSMYYYQPCLEKGLERGVANKEWLAFTIIVAINAFFTVVLISYSYFALKSRHYEYENYATTTEPSSKGDERQKLTHHYTQEVRPH